MSSVNAVAKPEGIEPSPGSEQPQQPGQFTFATLAIHAGSQADKWGMKQIVSPISLSTIYKYADVGETKEYAYSRTSNPNRHELETKMAALDDAKHCNRSLLPCC